MFGKIENQVLHDAMNGLMGEIKERSGEDYKNEINASKEIIHDLGISDEDWASLVQRSVMAFRIEQGMGMPVDGSINMTMFTAFALGIEYQKRLSLNSDIVPPEWMP